MLLISLLHSNDKDTTQIIVLNIWLLRFYVFIAIFFRISRYFSNTDIDIDIAIFFTRYIGYRYRGEISIPPSSSRKYCFLSVLHVHRVQLQMYAFISSYIMTRLVQLGADILFHVGFRCKPTHIVNKPIIHSSTRPCSRQSLD